MTKMVPLPSKSIVPERDAEHEPILETHRLGIDFGGLTAVDEVTLAIGRTEIGGRQEPCPAEPHRHSEDLPEYPSVRSDERAR